MAAVKILNPIPDLTQTWQLLKRPSIVQTVLSASQLMAVLQEVVFTESTVEVIDVSNFQSIAVQVWGLATNNQTFTLELYGWNEGGPGHHIQQMAACIFGNFASTGSDGFFQSGHDHKSIRDAFPAGVAWSGADTFLLTAAKDFSVKKDLVSPAVQIQTNLEADFPATFLVDFTTSRYKYFGVLVTALTATNVGAIFKPLVKW